MCNTIKVAILDSLNDVTKAMNGVAILNRMHEYSDRATGGSPFLLC